jgi:hypothetical protein
MSTTRLGSEGLSGGVVMAVAGPGCPGLEGVVRRRIDASYLWPWAELAALKTRGSSRRAGNLEAQIYGQNSSLST